MIKIFNDHNTNLFKYVELQSVNTIYADMIYSNLDFSWLVSSYEALAPNGSIFVQTDYRSVAQLKFYMDELFANNFFHHGVLSGPSKGGLINWIIWPYDWGGRPKNAFGRKHDDILWYVKDFNDYKFYPERVQIPKRTAMSGGLNPSGRMTKTPTDVWNDIGNFLTTDPERIIDPDTGQCFPWQKPERLVERIILSTTKEGDLVVDPFVGTGTTGAVCYRTRRDFVGLDNDQKMVDVAKTRIRQLIRNLRS